MNFDAKTAFLFFYAIFWSVLLPPMGKFSPFGIGGFMKGRQAALKNTLRFLIALLTLNLFPAGWLFLLLSCDSVVPKANTAPAILAGVFAALSVFSFVNLGYAFFGSRPWAELLYAQAELKDIESKAVFDKTPSKHLALLALFYIVVFPILAILAGRYA